MLLGSHVSVAGGVDRAFQRAEGLGLQTMQIFTRNQQQWQPAPLSEEVVALFHQQREKSNVWPVVSHGSYLINLCAPEPDNLAKSEIALLDELQRAASLHLPYLVLHPGSPKNKGSEWGMAQVAETINKVFQQIPDNPVVLLLENTAGQGNCLGASFEELAGMRDLVEEKKRVAYCFDTCHAFAAGYDLRTTDSVCEVFRQAETVLGLEHIRVFHANDSKTALGSRRDRHEHLGEGHLGPAVFEYLLGAECFHNRPMVLETPKSADAHEDLQNLAYLQSLKKKRSNS